MKGIAGKIAIVAGGASGVGRATCARLAELGATVAIFDLQDDMAKETLELIKAHGQHGIYLRTDVTNFEQVKENTQKVLTDLGQVDIMANTVGWNDHTFFVEQDLNFWNKVVAINMMGQIFTSRAVLDHMIERRSGTIVTVASDAGRVGTNGETVYAAAKGGVIAFTKSLSREVTRFGIRVNCVSPGPTDTPLFHRATAHQPKIREAMLKAIPMKRMAQPEEQAEAIVFLASDSSSYITGQTLSVNGGLNML